MPQITHAKGDEQTRIIVMSLVVNLMDEISGIKQSLFCYPISQELTVDKSASRYRHDVSVRVWGVTRKSQTAR